MYSCRAVHDQVSVKLTWNEFCCNITNIQQGPFHHWYFFSVHVFCVCERVCVCVCVCERVYERVCVCIKIHVSLLSLHWTAWQ